MYPRSLVWEEHDAQKDLEVSGAGLNPRAGGRERGDANQSRAL